MDDHVAQINQIVRRFFADRDWLVPRTDAQAVPLVAARLTKSTHSFSAGQLVYVYDVYWGMNERARVVARFRRKHKFVLGVCPIASLEDARPKIVHTPAVVHKLSDSMVVGGVFLRFFQLPGGCYHFSQYRKLVLEQP
jgi:hypothetical protein